MRDPDPAQVIADATREFRLDDPPSVNPDPSLLSDMRFLLTKKDAVRFDILSIKTGISRQHLFQRAINGLFTAHGFAPTTKIDMSSYDLPDE